MVLDMDACVVHFILHDQGVMPVAIPKEDHIEDNFASAKAPWYPTLQPMNPLCIV